MKITKQDLFIKILIIFFLCFIAAVCHAAGGRQGIHLDRIKLPPGFKIQLYARDVPNARSLVMSPEGILFVGTRHAGKVYAVLDTDHDYVADDVIHIVMGVIYRTLIMEKPTVAIHLQLPP